MEELLEKPNLKIVVCCRTFDLEHDPQLRAWEKDQQRLRRVQIGPLAEQDVTTALTRALRPDPAPVLLPREMKLLRHVLHLQMWLGIYKATGSIDRFESQWALMQAFWDTRRDELRNGGIAPDRAAAIERQLLDAMGRGVRLSARRRQVDATAKELELYQRLHLLQYDAAARKISFAHQSYLEYLVAKELLAELDDLGPGADAGHRVLEWLGDRNRQSLFRREQLRLLLAALRSEEHHAYLPALRLLLPEDLPAGEASPIRFHLRLLALQFLGQIEDPAAAETGLVLRLLDFPNWREHVVGEILIGHAAWFRVVDDAGSIEAWLSSSDPLRVNQTLGLLRSVAETAGDRVALQLNKHVERRPESWDEAYSVISGQDPWLDSDELFAFRLNPRVGRSSSREHIDWKTLTVRNPERMIALVVQRLAYLESRTSSVDDTRHRKVEWYGWDELEPSDVPASMRARVWTEIAKALLLLAKASRKNGNYGAHFEFEASEAVKQILDFLLKREGAKARSGLPKIAEEVLSEEENRLLLEIVLWFGGPDDSQVSVVTGWVSSPIQSEWWARMSDRAWLKLAACTKISESQDLKYLQEGRFVESSLQTFSSDFRSATQRQPERFARFLTIWPGGGHLEFLKAILTGLQHPADGGRRPEENWIPPSHAVLEVVFRKAELMALAWSESQGEVPMLLCGIVERYAHFPWSAEVLDWVAEVARHHPFPVWDPVDPTAKPHAPHGLEIVATGAVRGRAGYAIEKLLYREPGRLERLLPAIRALVSDPSPVLRTAAMAACVPLSLIDREMAIDLFLEACEGSDNILDTAGAHSFLGYNLSSERVIPVLERMLCSSQERIAATGARLTTWLHLTRHQMAAELERCIAGPSSQRKEVAKAASCLAGKPSFSSAAAILLLRLAEDPEDEVATEVARSFENLDLRLVKKNPVAWSQLARSRAAKVEPTWLIRSLKAQSGDILPFADCVLGAAGSFSTGEELATGKGHWGHAHDFVPLLLRLYEQADRQDPAVQQACLDAWDRLLETRSLMPRMLRELDQI